MIENIKSFRNRHYATEIKVSFTLKWYVDKSTGPDLVTNTLKISPERRKLGRQKTRCEDNIQHFGFGLEVPLRKCKPKYLI